MGRKEDAFYGYSDQFPQIGPKDPRLEGFSIADWFRSAGGNSNLQFALQALYGPTAFRQMMNHFNKGSGYATRTDYWENKDKRNAITDELYKRFQSPPTKPNG